MIYLIIYLAGVVFAYVFTRFAICGKYRKRWTVLERERTIMVATGSWMYLLAAIVLSIIDNNPDEPANW